MMLWENFQLALKRSLDFKGRSRRSEFWSFTLISTLFGIAAAMWDGLLFGNETLETMLNIAFFIPSVTVSIRRLHDVGKSGWWNLIAFTGIGMFYLLFLWAKDSEPFDNDWGGSPKYGLPEWEKETLYAEDELIV